MAKRSKKGSKKPTESMSAHAKIMQTKRRRDRVLLSIAGALVFGALCVGVWFTSSLKILEEDYSIVGLGEPVVVQVHQLNCGDCNILRANTRKALKQVNSDSLHYRMAYLHKDAGITFASRHGAAQPTTLILFDKFGRKLGSYYGVQDVDELVERFENML